MTQSRLHRIFYASVRVPRIRRWSAHVFFAGVVWPGLTLLGAAWALMSIPYYALPLLEALFAAGAGTLLRLPDLILVGSIFFGLSGFIFSRLGAEPQPDRIGSIRLALEPLVMFVVVSSGVALWYPAVLSQPLFSPLASLPAATLLMLLAVLGAAGVRVTAGRGKRLKLAGALFAMGVLSPAPLWLRASLEPAFGAAPTLILLGVDSISHSDDIAPLGYWVNADGGTWYERAVTPGLLTDAVWTSILTQRPVREHRVFHTFQRMRSADAALLHAARAQGYRTVASFSDQLTSAVGSHGGFDEDRSGPVGWRQLLLPIVANSSLLVPVLGSALPRPWPGASPSNEAGTFTYDLRREVRSLLRAGREGQPTFVAAHLTYVHLPVYPSALELSLSEFLAVMKVPARTVRDRTFDWQDVDLPGDALPLNQWKIRRLQAVIRREVTDARYLQQGGRMVLFSDHGSREGLTIDNFQNSRYHHVVLATFGLPSQCPKEPVSLIDIGRLIGFNDVRAEPSVEFALPERDQWPELVRTARLRWSGDVDLDEELLAKAFADLRGHHPWPTVPKAPGTAGGSCR